MPNPVIPYGQNPTFPGTAVGRATTFGFQDPEDSGVGAPSLGNLSTDNDYLHGVAVPQKVLIQNLGKDHAAWRTARADITNLNTLQTMRVPIVDIGPGRGPQVRGVMADFTAGVDKAFANQGGDSSNMYHVSIVPNAGADVLTDPDKFWAEQSALNQPVIPTSGNLAGPDASAAASYF